MGAEVFDSAPACPDYRRTHLARRQVLKIGALGLTGLTLPRLLQAEKRAAGKSGATARSAILLFQFGGASHLDTFDPKPEAPAEIRGEFKAIDTNVAGVQICEHLPRLARIAHLYALARSVHHNRSSHNPGAYYSLTGREPLSDLVTSNAAATDFPHPGSVVDCLLDQRGERSEVPRFVSLPTMIADGPFRTPGEFAGLLGKKYDPLFITRNPNSPDFAVPELSLPPGVSLEQMSRRRELHRQMNKLTRFAEDVADARGMTEFQERAIDLLTSRRAQEAFALHLEPDKVRDRYGRHTYGQSCLLARRLIEAGVRFVTVYYSAGIGGWDTHQNNFSTLRDSRLPHTDGSVSALLEDLDARGLLGETLVYWTGDFGRTPKVNGNAGRDHWPPCQTVLLAGGGVRGGMVHGSSDSRGAYPATDPILPDDITATVFSALGFDPRVEIRDQLGRPMPISRGEPVGALFS